MAKPIHSNDFFGLLKQIIPNLPSRALRFTLIMDVNELVQVNVEMYAEIDPKTFEELEIKEVQYLLIPAHSSQIQDNQTLAETISNIIMRLAETREIVKKIKSYSQKRN